MAIPVQDAWSSLAPAAKRERLLAAARELFAREGLGASMPALAAAAGAGVGSVYRQFADKDDLVAALVLQRLEEVRVRIEAAPVSDDAWGDLCAMVWSVVEGRDGCDDVMTEAIAATSAREDVAEVRAHLHRTIERFVERARAASVVRPDAELEDVFALWAAVRDADRRGPGRGRRVAELMLAGLRAG